MVIFIEDSEMQNPSLESSKGWRGDSKGHAKAGRKGGLKTAKKGTEYFKLIGRLGGVSSAKSRHS